MDVFKDYRQIRQLDKEFFRLNYNLILLICEWCLRGMIISYTFVGTVDGFKATNVKQTSAVFSKKVLARSKDAPIFHLHLSSLVLPNVFIKKTPTSLSS